MRRYVLATGAASVLFAATALVCAASADTLDPSEEAILDSAAVSGLAQLPNGLPFRNPDGFATTYSTTGVVDRTGAFFQPHGTNARTCETCHLASQGWTISAAAVQRLFDKSDGLAPLFDFDGQNCVGADRSTTEARRAASSVMLAKADVRFFKVLPASAEFEIVAAEGTYCNPTDAVNFVVFRRPLPTVNFNVLGAVLWDGRATVAMPNPRDAIGLVFMNATRLHEQTTVNPTPEQVADGVAFMTSITNAQILDFRAGLLVGQGAKGGARNLAQADLTGPPGFTIFDSWTDLPDGPLSASREQIARGQDLFNNLPFGIFGVNGVPDGSGTCATCHSVSNLGNTADLRLLDLGISDALQRTPDLPLYTLRNKVTGELVQSSDPGVAIQTGRWADLNRFKVPNLRGLASRAPYFHNGTAATLDDVVNFYDNRFGIGISDEQRADLVAFLRSL